MESVLLKLHWAGAALARTDYILAQRTSRQQRQRRFSSAPPQIEREREFAVVFFARGRHRAGVVVELEEAGGAAAFRFVGVDGKVLVVPAAGVGHMPRAAAE